MIHEQENPGGAAANTSCTSGALGEQEKEC